MKTIKVYTITTPAGRKFTTKDVRQIERAPVGSSIAVRKMTLAEYNCIPATMESHAFFAK